MFKSSMFEIFLCIFKAQFYSKFYCSKKNVSVPTRFKMRSKNTQFQSLLLCSVRNVSFFEMFSQYTASYQLRKKIRKTELKVSLKFIIIQIMFNSHSLKIFANVAKCSGYHLPLRDCTFVIRLHLCGSSLSTLSFYHIIGFECMLMHFRWKKWWIGLLFVRFILQLFFFFFC